jgi:hypothetical protein
MIEKDCADFIVKQPGTSEDLDYVREMYRARDKIKARVRSCAFRSVDVLAQAAQRMYRGERDKEKLREETKLRKLDCVWKGVYYCPKEAFNKDWFEVMWRSSGGNATDRMDER